MNQRRCRTQGNSGFSTQCGADQRRNPLLTYTKDTSLAHDAGPDRGLEREGEDLVRGAWAYAERRGLDPLRPESAIVGVG